MIRRFAPGADDSQCRACHAATGGNPFLLRELARSAVGGDGSLDSERVLEQSPERVTQEIDTRLARLPEPAVRLARAVAILGGDVPLRPAAGLAEIDPDEATEAVDALVAAGILRPPLPHELLHPLEFVHPLVRTAVYAGLGPAGRSRDHARAARLLDLEAGSPELVAAQLLRCQPSGDPWAYERLVAAARLASARGAADAATLYLRRAIDEPPPPRSRAGALLDLAAAEFRNMEPGRGDRPPARGDGRRARPGPALPRDDAARGAARPDRPGRRRGRAAGGARRRARRSPGPARTGGGGARQHHADRSGHAAARGPRRRAPAAPRRRRRGARPGRARDDLGGDGDGRRAGRPDGRAGRARARRLRPDDRLGGGLVGLQRRALARRGGALRHRAAGPRPCARGGSSARRGARRRRRARVPRRAVPADRRHHGRGGRRAEHQGDRRRVRVADGRRLRGGVARRGPDRARRAGRGGGGAPAAPRRRRCRPTTR